MVLEGGTSTDETGKVLQLDEKQYMELQQVEKAQKTL